MKRVILLMSALVLFSAVLMSAFADQDVYDMFRQYGSFSPSYLVKEDDPTLKAYYHGEWLDFVKGGTLASACELSNNSCTLAAATFDGFTVDNEYWNFRLYTKNGEIVGLEVVYKPDDHELEGVYGRKPAPPATGDSTSLPIIIALCCMSVVLIFVAAKKKCE